jgi:uncharacterized membrane protein
MEFIAFLNIVALVVIFVNLEKLSKRVRDVLQETEVLKSMLRKGATEKGSSVEQSESVPQPSVSPSIVKTAVVKDLPDTRITYHKTIGIKSEQEKVELDKTIPPPLPEAVTSVHSAMPESVPSSKTVKSANRPMPSWAGKMWNWILVGKEYRPAGMPIEFAVASIWMLRVAVVALVMGMGFFLNMAANQPFPGGEYGRIALAFMIGSSMLGVGLFLLGKRFNLNGEGLVGGGLLILYFCCYAAGPLYGLIDAIWAFLLMAVITVASGVISVKVNSLMIAMIGLAGGYAAPYMLPTGAERLPLFYSYIVLLSIGVWLVVRLRPWRLLLYSSFVCSYLLVLGSLSQTTPEMFGMVMGFVTAIFGIYATMVYVHNIHNEKPATLIELMHVVLNALIYAGIGYWLIQRRFPNEVAAVLSVSLATFYMMQFWIFLKFRIKQYKLNVVLLALTAGFIVWTLPLLLKNGSLTIGFAILALIFLWLGQKLRSTFLQNLSYGIYIFTFSRLLLLDLNRSYGHGLHGMAEGFTAYFRLALSRFMTFGIPAASAFTANYLLRKPRPCLNTVKEEKDLPVAGQDAALIPIFKWAVALLVFTFMLFEFNDLFTDNGAWGRPVLTLIWCLMAGYCLFGFIKNKGVNVWAFGAVLFFVIGSVIKLLIYDALQYDLNGVLYSGPYTVWECFSRSIDFSFVIVLLFVVAWVLRTKDGNQKVAPFFGYGGLALLLLYQTLEVRSLLAWKVPDFIEGGTSVLWALNAIVYIIVGMIKSRRGLRYIGLGMFVVVVFKVFLVDLQDMPLIYRVVALIVVGIIMLAGSFIYVFSSGKFSVADKKQEIEEGNND